MIVNREKKEKKSILPGVILVAFIASIGTFLILLNMEKNALTAYEKISVWCAKEELASGLEITQGNIEQYFVQVEIDKSKIPQELIGEPEKIIGMQTLVKIPKGTIFTKPLFREDKEDIKGMQMPVIAGCKGDDLFQLVSGVLRKGDRVHIYTVNEELEETYMLWDNVMVYQVFDSAGNVIAGEDIMTPAARVNLVLEEGYAEQFYNELNTGSLRLVKVWK